MRIWMRRSSHGVGTLHVIAMTGAPSSHAQPTPVAMLVAPGPRVERQTPGVPVRLPTAVAMKPADVSLAVSTYETDVFSRAFISGNTGPLGTPKTHCTPASSNVFAIKSTFFIQFELVRRPTDAAVLQEPMHQEVKDVRLLKVHGVATLRHLNQRRVGEQLARQFKDC